MGKLKLLRVTNYRNYIYEEIEIKIKFSQYLLPLISEYFVFQIAFQERND
jgi:hypothetical protein